MAVMAISIRSFVEARRFLVMVVLGVVGGTAGLAACDGCAAGLRGGEGAALLEVFDHHTAEIYEYEPAGEKT